MIMFLSKHRRDYKFTPGEVVNVKSREDISQLLNNENKLDGFLFMEQMWQFCGSTYPILKVVKSIFNEHKKRTYRPTANIYILDHILCDGNVSQFQFTCDHACFLLWHEDWLEKVQ